MGNFCVSLRSFLLGHLFFTGKNLSKTIFEYLKNLFSLICGFWFPVTGFQFFILDSGFQFLGFRVAPSFNRVFALHSVYAWLLSSIGRLISLPSKINCNNYCIFHHLFLWWNDKNPSTRSQKHKTNLPGNAYSSSYCLHMPSINWYCLDIVLTIFVITP